MTFELTHEGEARLEQYFDRIGALLGDRRRRASFAIYATGVVGDHARKSSEPLAAAAAATPQEAARLHDHLLHFVGQSEWDDETVRRFASGYALDEMTRREAVRAWIIDDTGFLKQGKHSPGVQRQYTGSAGKTANCQIGVSLTVATDSEHLPIDMQLYLPESWAADRARCAKAKVPDDVVYRPKWKIALRMIDAAKRAGVPVGVALADAAYGNVSAFRSGLRLLGFEYAVGVNATTVVTPCSNGLGLPTTPIALSKLAKLLPRRAYRNTTWRQGSRRAMLSRFAMLRVEVRDEEAQWLLIEWPENEAEPSHFTLGWFANAVSRKKLIRITKDRWRTERVYQDLKGELGLDHYEGRSYRGWHHHVTVVLCCFAFITNERLRHFPPSRGRARPDGSLSRAA